MKKIYLFTLLIFVSICACSSVRDIARDMPFVYISFDMDSCLSLSEKNKYCFIISNRMEHDIWINAWNLAFYLDIYDEDGKAMSLQWKNEKLAPDTPQYVLVKGNSERKVCPDKMEMSQWLFKQGIKYTMHAKYHNTVKCDSGNTYIGEIGPYYHTFSICE